MNTLQGKWPPDWWSHPPVFGPKGRSPSQHVSSWEGRKAAFGSPRQVVGWHHLRCVVFWLGYVGMAGWLMIASPVATADTSQEPVDDAVVVTREVTGTVSAITPQFINIVYSSDKKAGIEYEMPLAIGKDVELRYKRSLHEITFGDTVSVKYAEKQRTVTRDGGDGREKAETQIVSREVQRITFLKTATQGLVSED